MPSPPHLHPQVGALESPSRTSRVCPASLALSAPVSALVPRAEVRLVVLLAVLLAV